MSEHQKGNSAKYLWKIGIKGLLMITRSDIRMGDKSRVGDGTLYMQRLLIEFGKRRRSLRLHVIHRADNDNCLHDHPWHFKSIVLWGGYEEEIPARDFTPSELAAGFPRREINIVKPFRFRSMPLWYKHRIIKLYRGFSVTLAYAGPLSQEWGFHTKEGKIFWWDFVNEDHQKRVLWCDHR